MVVAVIVITTIGWAGFYVIIDSIARPIKIFCNNSNVVFFTKNNKSGSKSKRIDIKYLSVKENIKRYEVSIEHTSTDLTIYDPMTKGLLVNQFKGHLEHMDLLS